MENIDTATLLAEIKKLNNKLENKQGINLKKEKRKEGTYQLNKNGTARLQYMLDGERYSDTIEATTEEEAESKLALFVNSIKKGTFTNTNLKYYEFMQIWFDKYVKKECSPSVIRSYKSYINKKILPHLGKYKLEKITTTILRDLFNDMKKWKTDYPAPRKNKPISKEAYRKIYNIIHSSLKYAFEQELIPLNPCDRIPLKTLHLERLPSELEKLKNKNELKKRSYNLDTYKHILNILNNKQKNVIFDKDRIKKIVTETILKTGLCLEELAGLQWKRDYSYKNSTLTVNMVKVYVNGQGWFEKEPKAFSRSRVIHIDKDLNELLYKLYKKFKNNTYIFSDLINLSTYTDWLKRYQIKNNITPVLTAHELRHTHLTIMLLLTNKIKAVSQRAGHSNIQMTLDTYVEPLEDEDIYISEIIENI